MPDIGVEPAEAIPMSSSRTSTIPRLASIFQRRNTSISIPVDSFGDEIKSERCRKLNTKVWFPRGEIKKTFEESLKAKIVDHLDGEGLTFSQVYLNLYIIGRSQAEARPKVVVCCEDSAKLMTVRASIRQSKVLKEPQFRTFDLGISSWPLETEGPVDKLAADGTEHGGEQTTQRLHYPSPSIEIFTTDTYPRLGAILFSKRLAETEFIRSATAGPTLRVLDTYYLLTVGHIRDVKLIDPPSNPDVLEIDGLSDSSDGVDESGGEETATSKGSLSFEESKSRSSSPCDIVFSPPGSPGLPSVSGPSVHSEVDRLIPGSLAERKAEGESPTHIMSSVGFIDLHCADGPMTKPGLDYALVNLNSQRMDSPDHRLLNRVELHGSDAVLELKRIAELPNDTVGVIAITSSMGIQRGSLVASSTFFRDEGSPSFQKLGVVRLDGAIEEGDCGSVVIDEMTGDVYGHIVMGCSGTNLAYIVPATELYEDIRGKLSQEVCFANLSDIQSLRNPSTADAPQQTVPAVLRTGTSRRKQLQLGPVQTKGQVTLPDYSDNAFFILEEDLEPPPSSPGIAESYGVAPYNNISTGTSRPGSPELCSVYAKDDTSFMTQPSRYVDYLSHDWKEKDIVPSWKHAVSRSGDYSNAARLENAAWRAWTKTKDNLQTVSPERLNWWVDQINASPASVSNRCYRLKDCDVTWLYGPLQTSSTDLLSSRSTGSAGKAGPTAPIPSVLDETDKEPTAMKRSTPVAGRRRVRFDWIKQFIAVQGQSEDEEDDAK